MRPSSGSQLDPTLAGSALGTPAYMSPEQAQGRLDLVGPPSDVYCLSLTLYHLLTGRAPCEDGRLADVIRKIGAGDFPHPRTLNPRIAPALEAVCLKAIGLRPEDRYESAEGLKSDVERWLADEPVTAWREPLPVRTRRWMRRHRTLMVSAAAVLVFGSLALVGFVAALAGKNRELDEKTRTAIDERNRAVKAEMVAKDEEAKTKRSEAEARAVLDFFQDHVLAATRPEGLEGGLGKEVTIRRAMDAAEPKIAETFRGQPTVEAAIRDTIGETYDYLDEPALAIRQHERSLQLRRDILCPDHPDTLTSMGHLGYAYLSAGRSTESLQLLEEALRLRKSKLGAEHTDTLFSMNSLAIAYGDAGRPDKALPLLEETLRLRKATLGADDEATLYSMNNLGVAYDDAGRPGEALPLLEETLKRRKALIGAEHPNTITSMRSLADVYQDFGRFDDAVSLLEQALKLLQARMGPEHFETLMTTTSLAAAYRGAGRINESVPLLEEVLKVRKAKLGNDSLATLISMGNLASVYDESGRRAEALPLYEETLKLMKANLGADHPRTLSTMNNLAITLSDADKPDRAIPLFEEAYKLRKAKFGTDHADTLQSQNRLARAYLDTKPGRAEGLLRDGLAIREIRSPDDWRTFEARTLLGASLLCQGKFAEAEPFLLQGYEGLKARQARIPARSKKLVAEAGQRVVALYTAWGKPAEVDKWKRLIPTAPVREPKISPNIN